MGNKESGSVGIIKWAKGIISLFFLQVLLIGRDNQLYIYYDIKTIESRSSPVV